MVHLVRVKTAGGRSFELTPWVGLHTSVNRWALEHGTLEHGTLEHGAFVLRALELWPFKLRAFHWWAFEWRHHSHGVLVNRMSLHTAITRVAGTTTPLQLCDGFMCRLVDWFVHQTILESWTFLTPGTLVVLCFYIWGCPILHGERHCLFNHIGTVVLVSAGGFPLVMVLTEPSFILVKLEWSVELGFGQ